MPGRALHPPVAFLGAFDARPWAGLSVLGQIGTNTSLADTDAMPTRWPDLVTFLNGRGSPKGLADLLVEAFDLEEEDNEFACYIDEDDHVVIECLTGYEIRLLPHPANAQLGWSTTEQSAVSTGGKLTAPGDWIRGAFWTGTLEVEIVGEDFSNLVIAPTGYVQDVPTFLRSSGLTPTEDEDLPDEYEATFQYLACARYGQTTRFGITDDGRVFMSWPSSYPRYWVDESFRKALGFGEMPYSSSMAYQTVGSFRLAVADNPPPSMIMAELARCEHGVTEDGSTNRYDDGRYAGIHRGSFDRLYVDLYLDGPAHPNDQEQHALRWLKANPGGAPVTFYRHWGDPRRAQHLVDSTAYSLTRTPELDGKRGRVICERAPMQKETRLGYEHDLQVEARLSLTLDVVEV